MDVNLRLPNISPHASEREMLLQIRSYLYQLVPELQMALGGVVATEVSSGAIDQIARRLGASVKPGSGGGSGGSAMSFNELKSLIIKSSDIVEAYYEKIEEKLRGVYVAESDFGNYKKDTEDKFTQTSAYSEHLYTNYESIQAGFDSFKGESEEEFEKLKEQLGSTGDALELITKTTAHIKTGVVDRVTDADGNEYDVYGLEIGQRTEVNGEERFNKYARFTSEKLSFYDESGAEVAYISDRRLYIRGVEIRESFKMGGFLDTVMSNGDVVTKWIGGNS